MSVRAALVLAICLILAALLHGGLYAPGHDFVVNRFTGRFQFVPERGRGLGGRGGGRERRQLPCLDLQNPARIGSAGYIAGGDVMAGGRAFKSNVRERREAERRMKALEKRQKKEEKRREEEGPRGRRHAGGGPDRLAVTGCEPKRSNALAAYPSG